MKQTHILFIVNSHVEIDNHLPIITYLNEINDKIKIDILTVNDQYYVYTDTFCYENIKYFKIKTIGSFKKNKILKIIFSNKLSIWKKSLKLKHRLVNKVFYFLKIWAVKYICVSKVDVTEEYNFVFTTYGIYENIKKLGKIKSLFHIASSQNGVHKIVLLPETYQQFNSKDKETFFNRDMDNIASDRFYAKLICKSDQTDKNFPNQSQSSIEIGWPRYSKAWCEKIDNFYGNQESIGGSKKILFLPIKASPDGIWIREHIQKHIKFAINYAEKERYDLLIKRHPRCNVPKSFWKETIKNIRLSMSLDTIECIIESDVIYSPGSSLLAHVLWSDKLIILDDAWVDKDKQKFIYKEYCHTLDDKSNVIAPKKKSRDAKTIFLQNEFQLALDDVSFDARLKNELAELINIH